MMQIATIPDLSLDECLQLVRQRFNVASIADRPIDQASVLDYFRQSDRGYRLFHSRQGAMHVALDCQEKFTADGYLGQVDLIAERLKQTDVRHVLEIGCGAGFNTLHLARRLPGCRLTGVDLSTDHVETARRNAAATPDLTYEQGDFQDLQFPDGKFDAVFAVESWCQASDKHRAIAEAHRVLRPGGRLLVIDCFRGAELETCDEPLQLAARLVEKTMAVNEFAVLQPWSKTVEEIGFTWLEQIDLSCSIRHNLERFYRLARRYFKMPRAARAFSHAFPERLLENSISGLLMPFTVGSGVHRYMFCVLERS